MEVGTHETIQDVSTDPTFPYKATHFSEDVTLLGGLKYISRNPGTAIPYLTIAILACILGVVCHNALNRSVREFGKSSTSAILDKTRDLVINEISQNDESVTDGMDISLCAFDKETNKISWSGANNPLWIYRKSSHTVEEIKADKQPIGYHRNPTPFNKHEVELHEGDRLYLFSDGYQDQFGGPKSKKMMRKGLKTVLLDSAQLSLKEQHALLNMHFINWKKNLEQVDDVCIIGIEYFK